MGHDAWLYAETENGEQEELCYWRNNRGDGSISEFMAGVFYQYQTFENEDEFIGARVLLAYSDLLELALEIALGEMDECFWHEDDKQRTLEALRTATYRKKDGATIYYQCSY